MLSIVHKITHTHIKNVVLSLIPIYKRVSFFSSFRCRGSMTVEGSLVLPLFLFYMATLLYLFEVVRFQSDVSEAMHQAGSSAFVEMGKEDNAAKTESAVLHYLSRQQNPFLCVDGGSSGVSVTAKQDWLGEGNLQIETSYLVKPFIFKLPIGELFVTDSCFLHGFVGYMGGFSGEYPYEEEVYVYITPMGTKYHRSDTCTYLKVQVQAVRAEELESLRNFSSEIYRACEVCNPRKEGILYLSKWGNRYHGTANCSSLQRTVYLVPISQVGNRTACKKCG